ncbi:MAG: ABC transporter substrate-binding protein [Propionibacteriaceae bacterium]|nr:ABC transporter substrate-binding protein [Propionibacteriaceae bacterium]
MAPQARWRRTLAHGLTVLTLLFSLTALSACSGRPGGPDSPTSKTLTVGATAEPDTLDLTTSDNAAIPQLLLYNVYETLVKLDSEGRVRPLLATAYELSEDELIYTFRIDPKAHFASGQPVDADAVVASLERMRQATSATIQTQMAVIARVWAEDSHTVKVELRHPSNRWLYDMTSTAGIVIDPITTDLANRPAGSGPFEFSFWNRGDRIVLSRVGDYWGTPGRFDQVTFRYFAEPNAMNTAMLSGEIDIISDLTSPSTIAMFADDSRFQVLEGTTNGEVVLGFNHDRAALSDRRVRQAINYAIDRQAIIDTVWGGKGQLIGSMVPPTDPYYEDLSQTYPYDPERARQLLAEAGWNAGASLSLRVPTLPYATGAAQVIASQLAQVGLQVQVEELDFTGRWLPEVYLGGDYDMTIVMHIEPRDIGKFADPAYYWHYNNVAFQELIDRADLASPSEQIESMRQAARLLADDAAADWLFLFPKLTVVAQGITGVPANATTLSFDLTTVAARS